MTWLLQQLVYSDFHLQKLFYFAFVLWQKMFALKRNFSGVDESRLFCPIALDFSQSFGLDDGGTMGAISQTIAHMTLMIGHMTSQVMEAVEAVYRTSKKVSIALVIPSHLVTASSPIVLVNGFALVISLTPPIDHMVVLPTPMVWVFYLNASN